LSCRCFSHRRRAQKRHTVFFSARSRPGIYYFLAVCAYRGIRVGFECAPRTALRVQCVLLCMNNSSFNNVLHACVYSIINFACALSAATLSLSLFLLSLGLRVCSIDMCMCVCCWHKAAHEFIDETFRGGFGFRFYRCAATRNLLSPAGQGRN
jgi:hypothetical protein